MNDLFFVFGGLLTVGAVVLAFLGMRSERFPTSRGALLGGLTAMAVLVVATCAWAVGLAREEREHHIHEYEEYFAEQEESGSEAEAEAESGGEEEPQEEEPVEKDAAAELVSVTSPEQGDLFFEPDQLEAKAGEVSVEYTNPSEVPHNVAIEFDGDTLAESEVITGGDKASATATLEPGEYVFYCAVPGHREAGMLGDLTVE